MKKLHEITRAIITHEKEEFDKTFTLSQIKELDEMLEGKLDSTIYNYIETEDYYIYCHNQNYKRG